VAQVVHTLPEGPPVLGITVLGDKVYVLRWKERDQVEVYNVNTYRLKPCLTVPNARIFVDMTSCEHHRCVYIGDNDDECVHRLSVEGAVTRWDVNDKPWGLSVNASHNVLVTCPYVRKIKEFRSHGDLLREIRLPDDIINPYHAIETRSGHYIVCHGCPGEAFHRVCKIKLDGRNTVHSHGGQPGSDTGQYRVPAHLAVDNNEFVFVADFNNRRVKLLSPTLDYRRQVVSRNELKWKPTQLCLDVHRRCLYVADNEIKNVEVTAGRVVVFSI